MKRTQHLVLKKQVVEETSRAKLDNIIKSKDTVMQMKMSSQ